VDALTFRAAQTADVLRLVVEPNLQVIVQGVEVTLVASPFDNVTHQSWVPPGSLWRYVRMTWNLQPDLVAHLTRTWAQVALGPNADAIRWPLRRLGIATTRPYGEDSVVDLWVALREAG